jgi:DNA-binding NarL/FixJ family response regulator
MPKSKMIVIWDSEDILSSSIEFLLAGKEDWKVIHISNKADLDALIRAVETTQQDIVIIQQACQNEPANLPLHLLQDHPTIKVITISLKNNLMDVYSKQKIMVKGTSDLINVIENVP